MTNRRLLDAKKIANNKNMSHKVFNIEQHTTEEADFHDQIERHLFDDLSVCVSGKAFSIILN